jgi:hypothetical protein
VDATTQPDRDGATFRSVSASILHAGLGKEYHELMQEPGWLFSMLQFMNEAFKSQIHIKYQDFYRKLLGNVVSSLDDHTRQHSELDALLQATSFQFVNLIPESWAAFTMFVEPLANASLEKKKLRTHAGVGSRFAGINGSTT